MFIYHRLIHVQDTDATGVLYFANELQIALEAFEEFLLTQGFSIGEMVRKNEILLPIVHTEGDFLSPLTIGDRVEVRMQFSKIGTTSFTHTSEIYKGEICAGKTSIVHVVYCPKKKEGIPIPEEFKSLITK